MKPLLASIATLLLILAILQSLSLVNQFGAEPFLAGILGALLPIFFTIVATVLYVLAFARNENPFK